MKTTTTNRTQETRTTTTTTETKGEKTMKTTATITAEMEKKAATARRIAKMRANLDALENEAALIIRKGDEMTQADRFRLLALVNVKLHEEGSKIADIFSIDSTAACEFCTAMRRSAADNVLMICRYCYAAADAWKEAAWRRHKLNAFILSTVLFTVEELAIIPVGALCRYNEDGDTVNETMARNYLRIAAAHPATRFGYWYKNAPAVEAGLHAEGIHTRDQLPENVRFIHSSMLIGFEARELWFDDAIFTVYPDEETTRAAIAAGAHECNGRKCRACGFNCYLMQRRPQVLHIAEVLRCSKAARVEIIAAYREKLARKA
jgi:hypothetical protein